MNAKAMVMLVLAVVSGLGAMVGTSKLLSKDKGPAPVEMQDVVVAARALKIEEVIKPDLLKIEQKPKAAIHPGSFSSIKDVEERWVQIGMLEGEQVLDGKLAPKGSPPGLTSRIPAGMRAIAVEVNEQTGVAGFVLPDHHVDVIQMLPSTNPQQPQEADTVLQDVLVLASGQTFTRPDDRSMQVRTVTLALTPSQVDIIVAARQRGPISLSLRGLNDHKEVVSRRQQKEKEKEVEAEKPVVVAVKAPEPAPPPPPPPPPVAAPEPPPIKPARFVVIYRGSSDRVERVRIDHAGSEFPETPPETQATAN